VTEVVIAQGVQADVMVAPTLTLDAGVPPVVAVEVSTGIPGPPGPPGIPGDAAFVFHQTSPAATWTIIHPLASKPPIVIVLDDDPTVPVFTDTFYIDNATVALEFPVPTTGYAYL
jgi:hypothetical protein